MAGALVVVVAVVCVRLGLWQLDRLEERRERNAVYSEALALPALELSGDTLDAVLARPGDYVYRRARVLGQPIWSREIVWRGRSLGGQPGVNLLTPYRLSRGVILVNRGWVPSPNAAHVELQDFREGAAADPVGILIPLARESEHTRPVSMEMGDQRVLSVQLPSAAALDEHLPGLIPVYVQALPGADAPRYPTRLPIPDLAGEGPHLGYAFQWFAFAAIACIGFLSVVFLRRRAPHA